jgi:cytochrome c
MLRSVIFSALVLTAASTAAEAGGDAGAGEKVFLKCRSCHQLGETAKNGIGPELNGIVGRPTGAAAGYKYSDAVKNSGITWDETNLHEFLMDPKAKIPGTKMPFAGIKDPTALDNLLSYLKQYGIDGGKL